MFPFEWARQAVLTVSASVGACQHNHLEGNSFSGRLSVLSEFARVGWSVSLSVEQSSRSSSVSESTIGHRCVPVSGVSRYAGQAVRSRVSLSAPAPKASLREPVSVSAPRQPQQSTHRLHSEDDLWIAKENQNGKSVTCKHRGVIGREKKAQGLYTKKAWWGGRALVTLFPGNRLDRPSSAGKPFQTEPRREPT